MSLSLKKNKSTLTQSARLAAKSVVRIQAHGFSETQIQSILDPRFVVKEQWLGSGFFIKVKNSVGYILTNSHVARNATHIEIQSILTSDELFRVEVVGLVEGLEPDVALLKLSDSEKSRFLKLSSEKKIPYLILGDSTQIQRSEEIRAIGYPLGMNEPNISGGEISNFISGSDEITERLVTDAPINPGNSGGPSITQTGHVIGINTSIIAGANNIGFITPIHLVKKAMVNLLTNQRAGLCRLAATIQKNSAANAQFLKMKTAEGVIVCRVFKNGLASKLGLCPKDVILSINGLSLDRHGNIHNEKKSRKRNLYDIMYEVPTGQPIDMSIIRKGKTLRLVAQATAWAGEGFPHQPILKNRRFICLGGLIIQEVCSEIADALSSVGLDQEIAYQEFITRKSKLIITHIDDNSPANDLDLGLGDFVVRAQGHPVKNLNQLKKQIQIAMKKKTTDFLIEFSSGSIANFATQSFNQNTDHIYKFGETNHEQKSL